MNISISLIVPGRNNLKYFKWSYESIRKHQGGHDVEICFADDASSDGTWEYVSELAKTDPKLKIYRNETGKRQGHTILYDKLVNEYATNDLCMIWHCDMYLTPGALDSIQKHMYDAVHTDHVKGGFEYVPIPKTIVSLTRIEPPLHPDGPEKILNDFGTEPEEFDEGGLLEYLEERIETDIISKGRLNKTTEGIFAPWAFWKEDFDAVFGHDPLYAPQSKEDSDIFNKFHLLGVKFIQTWEGFVYHLTSRGNRRNTLDGAPSITQNNPEWELQNIKSSRNFIRKWGSFVRHDRFLKPIVPPKYNIALILNGPTTTLQQMYDLEPCVSALILVGASPGIAARYISLEQPNTLYDLSHKVIDSVVDQDYVNMYDVILKIDSKQLNKEYITIIAHMNDMLLDSGQIGDMEFGDLKIRIHHLIPITDTCLATDQNDDKQGRI